MYSTTERVTIKNLIGHTTCPKLLKKDYILPTVVVNGPFNHLVFVTNPKFLEFTKVKNDIICTFNKTGHFCQHKVTEIMSNDKVTFSLKNRIPKHFCTLFNGGKIEISFNGGSGKKLQHVYINMNQVHKFGGELLYFKSTLSSTTFQITENIVPKGTYFYITVIELVNNDVTGVELIVTEIQPTNSPLPSQSNSPSQSQSNSPLPSQSNSPLPSQSNSPSHSPIQTIIESEVYEPIVDDSHEFLSNFIQFNKNGYMTDQVNYSITADSSNIILVKSQGSHPTIEVSTTSDKPNYATFVSPQHESTQIIILNPSSEDINYGSGQLGVHANENVGSIILLKMKILLNLYSKGQSSFPIILNQKESAKYKLLSKESTI